MSDYYRFSKAYRIPVSDIQTKIDIVYPRIPKGSDYSHSEHIELDRIAVGLPESEIQKLASEVAPDIPLPTLLQDSITFRELADNCALLRWGLWVVSAKATDGQPGAAGRAYIYASPSINNRTKVVFEDGRISPSGSQFKPIGEAFEKFAQEILTEFVCASASDFAERDRQLAEAKRSVQEDLGVATEGDEQSRLKESIGVPKRQADFVRWQVTWRRTREQHCPGSLAITARLVL